MTEHNFLTLEYWTFTRDDRSKNGVPSQANAATGFEGGGQIMPTTLLLVPPWILKPSYGPDFTMHSAILGTKMCFLVRMFGMNTMYRFIIN